MRRHLLALSTGMRVCSYGRVHFRDLRQRLAKISEGAATAARRGHKGPNRLSLDQDCMTLTLKGRRSTSQPPDLIRLIASRPLISTPRAAKELNLDPKAVDGMLKELGLPRQLTGRSRYLVWGVVWLRTSHSTSLFHNAPKTRPTDAASGLQVSPSRL